MLFLNTSFRTAIIVCEACAERSRSITHLYVRFAIQLLTSPPAPLLEERGASSKNIYYCLQERSSHVKHFFIFICSIHQRLLRTSGSVRWHSPLLKERGRGWGLLSNSEVSPVLSLWDSSFIGMTGQRGILFINLSSVEVCDATKAP